MSENIKKDIIGFENKQVQDTIYVTRGVMIDMLNNAMEDYIESNDKNK